MRIRLAVLFLALLAAGGCAKVKPGPYQVALERYYRSLLGGTSEESLNTVIAGLTQDLEKHPADSGLLILRTSARLELLKLGVTNTKTFVPDRATAFFADLQLLQSLLERPGDQPPWLAPRVQTMLGDAVLLQTQAMPENVEGAAAIAQATLQMQLFRLAADSYLRAGTMAKAAGQQLALIQEIEKARDGYNNALTGLAQSELSLRLNTAGRQHLTESLATTAGGSFPPAASPAIGTAKLDRQVHLLLVTQLKALESLTPRTPTEYPARIDFALSALREEAAARMLANPFQAISATTMPGATAAAPILAGLALLPSNPIFENPGNASTESITLNLKADPVYTSAEINARVPFLILQIGTERTTIPLGTNGVSIAPAGIQLTIRTGSGTTAVSGETGGTVFLSRTAPLLDRGKLVTIFGPGDRKLCEAIVP